MCLLQMYSGASVGGAALLNDGKADVCLNWAGAPALDPADSPLYRCQGTSHAVYQQGLNSQAVHAQLCKEVSVSLHQGPCTACRL